MHKVILLGDFRAGKTSLLRRLRGQDFNKDEQPTQGAEMVMVNNHWESANCVDVAEIMTEECLSRQHQKDRHKAEEERLRAQWVAQEKWERDSESDSCRVCEKTFGVFRRRHHCRKCGRLVCGNCSKYAPALCSSSGIIPERLPCLFLQKSQPVFWEICTHLRQLHRF